MHLDIGLGDEGFTLKNVQRDGWTLKFEEMDWIGRSIEHYCKINEVFLIGNSLSLDVWWPTAFSGLQGIRKPSTM